MNRLTSREYLWLFKHYDLNRFMTDNHMIRQVTPFVALHDALAGSAPDYLDNPAELDEMLLDSYAGRDISKALAACYNVDWSATPPAVQDWSTTDLRALMLRIFRQYQRKWDLLFEDLTEVDYNPIENYNATETETSRGTRQGETSGTETVEATDTMSGTEGIDDTETLNSETDGRINDTVTGTENVSGTEGIDDSDTLESEVNGSVNDTGSMTESSSGSDNKTLNLSHAHAAESEKTTEALGQSLAAGLTAADVIEEGDVAGFNSTPGTFADSNRVTRSGTTATQKDKTYTGTDTDTGTDNTAHTNDVERTDGHDQTSQSTRTDSGTYSRDIEREEERTRSETKAETTHSEREDSIARNRDIERSEERAHDSSLSRSGTESETSTGNVTRTRHGNIGVTTTQQMLTAEIEMRSLYQFYAILVEDVANVLTLHIY